MNNYSFEKGMLIIIENIVKGITLILPLLFEGGIIRQLMYVVLVVFICKGVYDLYRESTLHVEFAIYLFMAVAGLLTGYTIGFIAISMYCGLVFEFRNTIERSILICLPTLSIGIVLAYKLAGYKRKI